MKLATRQARKVCTLALVRLKRHFIGENSGRDLFVRKGTFDHYHQTHCGLPTSVLPSGSTAATRFRGRKRSFRSVLSRAYSVTRAAPRSRRAVSSALYFL